MINKRVLFLATVNPFELGGGSQANRCYLDATLDIFGSENVDVMIADEVNISPEYNKNSFIRISERTNYEKITGIFEGFYSRFTKALILFIRKNKDKYGLVIINGGVPAGKAVRKVRDEGIKTIVIHHNYEVEYHRDNKTVESFGGHYLRGIIKAERSAYKYSDLNIFLTSEDERLFENAYGKQCGLNKAVGVFDYKNSSKVIIDRNEKTFDIAISGTLGNYQTIDGVMDFYNQYYQVTKQLLPNLKIVLTGRNPKSEIYCIQNKEHNSFSIMANPDNIYKIVQQAKIYLCPVCIGGGLKLRAMDGLKCGLPVLAHAVSARGYDYFYNKEYFKVYSDESSYRKGLADLIKYCKEKKDDDKKIVEDYYNYFGYEAGKKRFGKILEAAGLK